MRWLVVLVLACAACNDPAEPEPCQPAVLITTTTTQGDTVRAGVGCFETIRWY